MKIETNQKKTRVAELRFGAIAFVVAMLVSTAAFSQSNPPLFTPGNLVVVVEGCGLYGGTCTSVPNGNGTGANNSSAGGYGDNQGAPITLFQFAPNGTTSANYVNSLVLPQSGSGANLPISGEYGSSSEGTLQLAGTGQYLTLMTYGINAATFDANPPAYGAAPSNALAQSGSLTGQSYTPVARVLTLVDPYGNTNSSTPLYNIYDTNNPRSACTLDGVTAAYVSGQGSGSDATGGVFLTSIGAPNTAPTAITGLDTSNNSLSQDTRDVQIVNNTLYISVDTKEGSGSARSYIGTLGTPPATGFFNSQNGPIMLNSYGNSGGTGKETITTGANGNGNAFNAGLQINLSPMNYFFANASTLYVADGGNPKNNSANSSLGDGGLQKWVNGKSDGSGSWTLEYTLYQGLGLVENNAASGATGLYGLAGVVTGTTVQLYATSYTLQDLDPTYLYGITDTLSFTKASQATAETFSVLAQAPSDSNFKGVSFAPVIPAGGVSITSVPSGLAFTSSGTGCAPGTYTTPQMPIWTPGSSCTLTAVTPQAGPAGVQYAFAQWQDGTTAAADSVVAPSTPAVYTATFATQYQLTTSTSVGGSVTPGEFVAAGTNATITATPFPGYYFVNFTGAVTSTSNPLVLPVTGPIAITANFAPQITPTITWTAPAAVTYGSALSATQLDASASVPGTFTYNPPAGTVLPVGTNETLSVTFTPTDSNTYTSATGGTTIAVNQAPSGPANLVVTRTLTRTGGNVVVQVTVANTGGTAAANVVLSSVKVGSYTAAPLPQSLGTIAAGASAQAIVSVPGSVGASGAASSLTLSGACTGGTFSSSARITLP